MYCGDAPKKIGSGPEKNKLWMDVKNFFWMEVKKNVFGFFFAESTQLCELSRFSMFLGCFVFKKLGKSRVHFSRVQKKRVYFISRPLL